MMLFTKNYGMPVPDLLSTFLVMGSEFIIFHKVTWNR